MLSKKDICEMADILFSVIRISHGSIIMKNKGGIVIVLSRV